MFPSPTIDPPICERKRQVSGVSKITHRGYLLKRSNQPYTERWKGDTIGEPDDLPELPLMPGMFSPRSLEDSLNEHASASLATKKLLPLHATLVTPSPVEKTYGNVGKNPIQQGLDAAATFFGLSLAGESQKSGVHDNSMGEDGHLSTPKVIPEEQTSSKPIKVLNQTQLSDYQEQSDSFHDALHRRHSAPMSFTPDPDENDETEFISTSPPRDFVDPIDGHVWRAKYCVLDDGILYFYRNMTDGESTDAARERSEDSSTQSAAVGNRSKNKSSISDLSKSPMTRHFYHHHLESNSSRDSASSVWEKRVVLDCVGAVRSAEREYGPHSFELQGIDNDDDSSPADTLVLRANDHSSMTEWIFQFHRSLASFVRDIVDVFGSTRAYLDIDFPATTTIPTPETPSGGSEEKLQRLLSRSPRLTNASPQVGSLSHGHGRITLHRRRDETGKLQASNQPGPYSFSSSLGTRGMDVATTARSSDSSPNANIFRMSPGHSSQERFLFSPVGQTGRETSEMTGESAPSLESKPADIPIRKYIPPSLRMQKSTPEGQLAQNGSSVDSSKRYVPPGLRNRSSQQKVGGLRSLEERETLEQEKHKSGSMSSQGSPVASSYLDALNSVGESDISFHRGGCADPKLVSGSIMDSVYIPRAASKLLKSRSEAFGSFGGEVVNGDGEGRRFSWETGAVSECGIRNSNEDAYLIVHDLGEACLSPTERGSPSREENLFQDPVGLFAIFDGHCGNQAARYTTEKLIFFLEGELRKHLADSGGLVQERRYRQSIESSLRDALKKLDDEFCHVCQAGGRDWESGTTAIIAMIVNKWLIIANIGDCRGVVCRSVSTGSSFINDGWNELDIEIGNSGVTSSDEGGKEKRRCVIWQEVAQVHKPSDEQEKARIERANGWVTTETEIPIGQLRRMDFLDEDVVGILRRCFSDRYENSGSTIRECKAAPQRILQISRVCGELAVSRALGDRDFKAAFHTKSGSTSEDKNERALWDSPLLLAYPNEHSRFFQGDLVDNSPDFQQIQIGDDHCSEEFILLASDGLWVSALCFELMGFTGRCSHYAVKDVLDVDDAARVTRDLLFRRQWTAKRAVRIIITLSISHRSASYPRLTTASVSEIRRLGWQNWQFTWDRPIT